MLRHIPSKDKKNLWRFAPVLCGLIALLVCFAPALVHAAETVPGAPPEYNCDPNTPGFQKSFVDVNTKFFRFQAGVEQKAYREMQLKDSGACMIKIMGYFDVIGKILTGTLSVVAAVIFGAVSMLINYVCQAIVTEINNLLASVCLPLPKLGFNLTLPQLQQQSCDGISLQNVISVQGFSNGIPGYGSIPSMSLDSAIRQALPPPSARPLSTLPGTAKP